MNKRQKKKFMKKYERKTWKNKKKLDRFFDRFSDIIFRYKEPLTDIVADSAGIPKELIVAPPDPVINETQLDQMNLLPFNGIMKKIIRDSPFKEIDDIGYSGFQ